MLNLSRCTIAFKKSANYRRFSLFLHLFALIMIFNSSFWLFFKVFFSLILVRQLLTSLRQAFPTGQCTHLDYFMNEWSLGCKNGQQFFYDKHRIILDTGIFFLLELTRTKHKKILVVFFDQLEKADFRTLKLIERLKMN